MASDFYLYTPMLTALPSGTYLVTVDAIDKGATTVASQQATLGTAGAAASISASGELDFFIHEGANLLAPASVNSLNGTAHPRIHLVLHSRGTGGTGMGGSPIIAGAQSVARVVRSISQAYSSHESAFITQLYLTTLHAVGMGLPPPGTQWFDWRRSVVEEWIGLLRVDYGIEVDSE